MTTDSNSSIEELAFAPTPIGEISLRRRRDPRILGVDILELKLGDEFLMSSLFHASEDALATRGLAPFVGQAIDVVIGGLGLGYTAAAALAVPGLRSLVVVDYLAAVIDWHRRGVVPLGPQLVADPRCRLVHADFFEVAQGEAAAFDPARPAQRYHAVLLDVDHSPRELLDPRSAAFYSTAGLTRLARQLLPQGVFALWSNDPPDDAFVAVLQTVFVRVATEVIRFPNPYQDHDASSTLYIAQRRLAG